MHILDMKCYVNRQLLEVIRNKKLKVHFSLKFYKDNRRLILRESFFLEAHIQTQVRTYCYENENSAVLFNIKNDKQKLQKQKP